MTKALKLGLVTGSLVISLASFVYAADNGGGGGSCPQWTSVRCTHWNLGPPPVCTQTECVADKKSDPPKSVLGTTNDGKKHNFPVLVTGNKGLKSKSN